MKKRNIIKLGLVLALCSLAIIPVLGNANNNLAVEMSDIEANITENNIELERYRDEIMIAEYRLEKADEQADEGGTTYYDRTMKSDYYPVEARANYDSAYYNYNTKLEELLLSAKKHYYNYMLREDEIALQEAKIDRLTKELEDIETKVELGLEKESTLTDKTLAIEKEKLSLISLNYAQESAILELNVLMNIEMTQELTLEEEKIPFEKYEVDNLEEIIDEQLETNQKIIDLMVEEELIDIQIDIYQEWGSDDEYEEKIEDLREDSVYNIDDIDEEKVAVEYAIRTSYNSLLNQYDEIAITELKIKNIELDIEATEKKVELGMLTESVLKELEESLAFEELGLDKAKLEYYIAVETFKNLINLNYS